jgi:hypothetical protein
MYPDTPAERQRRDPRFNPYWRQVRERDREQK